MINLYGSVLNGIQTTGRTLQNEINTAQGIMEAALNSEDPEEIKRFEIQLKAIEQNLTYFKGVEDLLVKMANLPN